MVHNNPVCLIISIMEEQEEYSMSTQDQSVLSLRKKSETEKKKREFMSELSILENLVAEKIFWQELKEMNSWLKKQRRLDRKYV